MKTYHVLKDGENQGPFTLDEMQSRMQRHYFADDDLCWTEGMAEWEPVKRVISSVQSSSPPPTPKIPPSPVQENNRSETLNPNIYSEDSGGEGPQRRPWIRYWARILDFSVFTFVAGFILGSLDQYLAYLVFVQAGFLWPIIGSLIFIPIEGWMLSTWGATPFKALLNIKVVNNNGSLLSYSEACIRTFKVFWFGEGAGIPIINFFAMWRARTCLETDGVTRWDREGNIVVAHKTIGAGRSTVAIVVGIVLVIIATSV